jgi:YVTN family beta-propeller protein
MTEAPVGSVAFLSAPAQPNPPAGEQAQDQANPPASDQPQFSKLRVFVAAEYAGPGGRTGEIWVLEGTDRFELINRIPVGAWPHQLSVSPNGKWVAVANRSSNEVSVIDPIAMVEVARVRVGQTPHGITWKTDSSEIYLAHEASTFIGRVEAETWRVLPGINVGVRQHVTASWPERPNELWFTVTLTNVRDQVGIVDLDTGRIQRIPGDYVHDLFFTPDGSEVWVTHGGFLEQPINLISIYDPFTRRLKEQIRLPNRYPFHNMKANRDGIFFLPGTDTMVLSDHIGPSLLFIDWRNRTIVGETRLGRWVFHTTYNPLANQLLTTSNADGMVNVIDAASTEVLQKVPVPKPHGIVAIGMP